MDYAEYINLGGSDRLTAHQERDLFLAMEAGLVAGAVRDGRLRCRTVAASHELELIAAEGHRAKERLWQAHLPLALKLARAVGRDRSDIVEDLVQAACIGLAEAMMRFDLRRGLRFSTFAWPSIRRRIAEEAMRRDSSRPVWRRRTERIVALKEEALTAELGRQAEDAEIAAALEVEVAWVRARRGCGSDVSIGDLWVLEGLLPAEPGTGMDADWLAEARCLRCSVVSSTPTTASTGRWCPARSWQPSWGSAPGRCAGWREVHWTGCAPGPPAPRKVATAGRRSAGSRPERRE